MYQDSVSNTDRVFGLRIQKTIRQSDNRYSGIRKEVAKHMVLHRIDDIPKREITSVSFTGHRYFTPAEAADSARLLDEIISILTDPEGTYKTTVFFTGGALGFDTLAAEAVLRARENRSFIRLELLLPCRGQENAWSTEDKRRYGEIKASADGVTVYADHYFRGCMQLRDRALADSAELVVAWLRPDETDGGTVYTVKYAEKKGKLLLNLCPDADKAAEEISISFS